MPTRGMGENVATGLSPSLRSVEGLLVGIVAMLSIIGTAGPARANGIWTQPVRLDSTSLFGQNPDVAMDEVGHALAVWEDVNGSATHIQARYLSSGSGWGPVTAIDSAPSQATFPAVAMDRSGDGFAVWRQLDGSSFHLWAAQFVERQGWLAPTLVDNTNVGNVEWPDVAMDSQGDAFAVWTLDNGTASYAYGDRFLAGRGWETPTRLGGVGSLARVAADRSGDAVAVWFESSGASRVFASAFTPADGWSNAIQIDVAGLQDATYPTVAFDGEGDAIAVWRQYDGNRGGVYANRLIHDTGWEGAVPIDAGIGTDAEWPQVAMDSRGDALVVWPRWNGSTMQPTSLVANRFSHVGGWETPVVISNLANDAPPDLRMDSYGRAVVAWGANSGGWTNAYAASFSPCGGWGAPQVLEADPGNADNPHIGMDSGGNATVVWPQWMDLTEHVRAASYSADPPQDCMPPWIVHTPVGSAKTGETIPVTATVTDNDSAVSEVRLVFTDVGGTEHNVSMNGSNGSYAYTIAGQTNPGEMRYHILATDPAGNARTTSEYVVTVRSMGSSVPVYLSFAALLVAFLAVILVVSALVLRRRKKRMSSGPPGSLSPP